MAETTQLEMLRRGTEAWNQWRAANRGVTPDLREANLINAELSRANLDRADLSGADLSKANLSHASLRGANLEGATLTLADLLGAVLNEAQLSWASFFGAFLFGTRMKKAVLAGANLLGASLMGADLTYADLSGAHLQGANFHEANLTAANLKGANLTAASLVGTVLEQAVIEDCWVHGISVWNVVGKPAVQRNLVITLKEDPPVIVSRLEDAQLVNLVLFGDRLTSLSCARNFRLVLLVGRRRSDRDSALLTLQGAIDDRGCFPILVDLEKPAWKDRYPLISRLAALSCLAVCDLTAGPSLRALAEQLIQDFPLLAIVPVSRVEAPSPEPLQRAGRPLEPLRYRDGGDLVARLQASVPDLVCPSA